MVRTGTRKSNGKATVDAFRHNDTRTNIPTQELRDFVAADESAPDVMLYPRDPSLDPQLVWKGKDQQDREEIGVPVVPIYIQEKIHPRAIIDDLRRQNAAPEVGQLDLFADFNGLDDDDFGKKLEFYEHQQHWTNRLILGDSLMVMTSLAEKEALKGKVQTIYIDPPYGIDFRSNWQVSTRERDVRDGRVNDATRQPEQVKAFRDNWKLGIHSYLAYLRDRLVVCRDLLTESGSVFVQIGDENVHLVRALMDEVFGPENFVVTIVVKKKGGTTPTDPVNDYILWFAKSRNFLKLRPLYDRRSDPGLGSKYTTIITPDGKRRSVSRHSDAEIDEFLKSGGKYARIDWPLVSQDPSDRSRPFSWRGKEYQCAPGNHWRYDPDSQMRNLARAGRLNLDAKRVAGIVYWEDWPYESRSNLWDDTGAQQGMVYVVQTPTKVVQRCLLMTTDPGDLVLDPTCGSGTTAYVAEQWGRRWITTDTSRVALALARTRLMAARYPYYLLADSEAGQVREAGITGIPPSGEPTAGDIRKGFVYRRAMHVTLDSIARNPDVREGMTREEMDRAITRHADTETLYDQPYEDMSRVRVSGPFTVESLSPHRVLSVADEDQDGQVSPEEAAQHGDFASMILDNLRKAGVQNGIKNEKIVFDRLETYPGKWINAEGEYTDADGQRRRVAVSIGPEHGTVGPAQVKSAALEAVKGLGFDILIICGFAFDAHVSEESQRYGTLNVLPAKMNPDLAMGDDFLKKTGSGNLFMIFGEPDIDIARTSDGVVVTINGLDVYDPTTGIVRASSTDEIASWFIDTDYNGESFFVRHAYFTGAGEPYTRLQRALRAEIDEDAWASLYRTESRPFPVPASGQIAIKVINHFGDEVMKVYEL